MRCSTHAEHLFTAVKDHHHDQFCKAVLAFISITNDDINLVYVIKQYKLFNDKHESSIELPFLSALKVQPDHSFPMFINQKVTTDRLIS